MKIKTPVTRQIYLLSGIIAVVPLWVGLWLVYSPTEAIPSSSALSLSTIYAALYLCYVTGARRGGLPELPRVPSFGLASLAGLLAMVLALIAIILPALIGLCALLAGFLLLALWDIIDAYRFRPPGWLVNVRVFSIVLTCLALTGLLLRVL